MTELGIKFAFEQIAEIKKIVTQMAEEQKPPSGGRREYSVSKIEWEDGYVEVSYSRYIGCGENEYDEKTFSIDQIIDFAISAGLI